jgi:hypothetical protein
MLYIFLDFAFEITSVLSQISVHYLTLDERLAKI